MNWSLNELEAMARKAARGAGYSWGLAEEVGKATRWLSAAGLPGPRCLAQLLSTVDGANFKAFTPTVSAGYCTAEQGVLCPFLTGVALCDGALDYTPPQVLTLSNLSVPLLLLPFASQAFETPRFTLVRLSWAGVRLALEQGVAYLDGLVGDLSCSQAASVTLEPVVATSRPPKGKLIQAQSRALLDPETCSRLEKFAQRTFAPATEASRLAGAGSGLSDND